MALFNKFKRNVPVMGAILLDARMEHVLLVRGFKGASCWGFPRGKIMKDESDADCAVREVRVCGGGGGEGLGLWGGGCCCCRLWRVLSGFVAAFVAVIVAGGL